MRIAYVTATGADDNTDIPEMAKLSRDYPIEWGILLTRRSTGSPRFPSYPWLAKLKEQTDTPRFRVAGHLCGGCVHELVTEGKPIWALPETNVYAGMGLTSIFLRYQLNFHGVNYEVDNEKMIEGLRMLPMGPNGYKSTLIMQMDGINDFRLLDVRRSMIKADPLFDRSHGAGVLPDTWPKPLLCFTGYAGGLTPDNAPEQLEKLADVVGGGTIWIDAETGLRNQDDRFDLSLVKRFVQAAQRYF